MQKRTRTRIYVSKNYVSKNLCVELELRYLGKKNNVLKKMLESEVEPEPRFLGKKTKIEKNRLEQGANQMFQQLTASSSPVGLIFRTRTGTEVWCFEAADLDQLNLAQFYV